MNPEYTINHLGIQISWEPMLGQFYWFTYEPMALPTKLGFLVQVTSKDQVLYVELLTLVNHIPTPITLSVGHLGDPLTKVEINENIFDALKLLFAFVENRISTSAMLTQEVSHAWALWANEQFDLVRASL